VQINGRGVMWRFMVYCGIDLYFVLDAIPG
jgi:hypothetical protein